MSGVYAWNTRIYLPDISCEILNPKAWPPYQTLENIPSYPWWKQEGNLHFVIITCNVHMVGSACVFSLWTINIFSTGAARKWLQCADHTHQRLCWIWDLPFNLLHNVFDISMTSFAWLAQSRVYQSRGFNCVKIVSQQNILQLLEFCFWGICRGFQHDLQRWCIYFTR